LIQATKEIKTKQKELHDAIPNESPKFFPIKINPLRPFQKKGEEKENALLDDQKRVEGEERYYHE